jgi:hypothetical protein
MAALEPTKLNGYMLEPTDIYLNQFKNRLSTFKLTCFGRVFAV